MTTPFEIKPLPKRQRLENMILQYQEIQKRNHPESLEWIKASKEINAIAKELSGCKS